MKRPSDARPVVSFEPNILMIPGKDSDASKFNLAAALYCQEPSAEEEELYLTYCMIHLAIITQNQRNA